MPIRPFTEETVVSEVWRLVDAVDEARMALLDAVSAATDAQAAFKPSPDEWSIVEILEHLYLAELGGITKIWAASNAVRAGNHWAGPLPNSGKTIEEVVAATWKPREAAPPVATPHLGGPIAAWVAAHLALRPLLRALAAALEDQKLDDIVFPHFLSGPLDARQRLEFLAFHIRRHTKQVRRVQDHPNFPAAA